MKSIVTRRPLTVALLAIVVLLLALILAPKAPESTSTQNPPTPHAPVNAAHLAVDPFGNNDGFAAFLYNNTNGLPTSEANAITQTSEGFIWIGSYAGLTRYDGHSFERVNSATGIASVVSLFVDSRDRLWIGTNDSGIAIMERGEFRSFSKAEGLGSASVRAITEDNAGNVYAATTKGVTVFSGDLELRNLNDSRLSGAYVSVLRAGAGGLLYGLTRDGSVFLIEEGRVIAYYTADDIGVTDINTIFPDPDNPGLAYFGTKESGIYHGTLSNLRKAEYYDISPLSYVNSIELYDDALWITTDNGICAIADGKVHQLTDVPLVNSIDHSMVDYQGNLWFTSSRQGIMKVVPDQFLNLYERHGIDPAVVNSTCVYRDLLMVGTDSGLSVLNDDGLVDSFPIASARTASGTAFEATDLIRMLDGIRIRSIVHDGESDLWISTFGELGLLHFDGNAITCFTKADGMPSDRVRAAMRLSDGTVGVACTGGAAIIDEGKITRVWGEKDGIENLEILTIAEAGNGDLLLGSDGDGIYIIGKDGVSHLNVQDGLSSDVILRMKYDSKRDLVWIVMSNGIAYMDADYQITTIRGFPYPNNFDLYENATGEMWVLSSNGIYVVSVDELIANEKIAPVYYGVNNGLSCIATANSYSELTKEGMLYIAGDTGVARVNIDVHFEGVDEIKMAVPFIEADGEYVYADDNGSFTIPGGTTRLTVYPFVYTYSLTNPKVSYLLEGFEKERSTVPASRLEPVHYTNLRGGTYRFVMQLRDSSGYGKRNLSVEILKNLSLSERLEFRIAAAVLAVIIILAVAQTWTHIHLKRLLKKREEDRLYIREMSEAFARVIDMKDAYTSGHSSRVAYYTKRLTRELGYDDDTVERYYNIALLHDIGKIGISGDVLNKPGRLTDEEFESIKSHTTKGHDALAGISIMPEIAIGAWSHHERPDGKGYPQGLKGDEIPRVAQIIAVADTFDAMYSDRPYRKRMNFDKAVSIIEEVRGTQLTEDVVDAFLRLVNKGAFRDPKDTGGGTTEDIDNIHKRLSNE